FVAHSNPDGYTLLFGNSSLASNGALYRSLDYSPTTGLRPISLVAKFPFFMFVPNSSPAKTVEGFIDYVKAHPGKPHHGFSRHWRRAASRRTVVHANGRNSNDARALSRRGASIY